MRIYVQIKSAGKRRPLLDHVPYEISDQIDEVRGLICEIVKIEVEKYNSKEKEERKGKILHNRYMEYSWNTSINFYCYSCIFDFRYSSKKRNV